MTRPGARFALVLGMFLYAVSGWACELEVTPDKADYKVGDTAIFKVVITQQHKPCRKEGEEPTITVSDKEIEVLAKTKLKKIAENAWQISYKTKILASKATFSAFRNCPDGGSTKKVVIEAKP